jgi:iron complex transport system permease protein
MRSAIENGRPRERFVIFALGVVCVVIVICALGMGRYSISRFQVLKILLSRFLPLEPSWTQQMENVVLNVRLPRVAGAVLVGASLSLSGAAYQSVFRNPLVSPDLLGVSSGASVGASLAILAHAGAVGIQLSALAFGIAAVLLSTALSALWGKSSPMTLVLSGIIVCALFSSILGLCQYMANVYEELPAIVYWTMGSLARVTKSQILYAVPPALAASAVLFALRWRVNLLTLGGSQARTLGVSEGLLRAAVIVCSTVLTACSVCVSGTVGWVGLITPHAGRLMVGPDNRYLFPASAITGAAFLTAVDCAARNITPSEIPLGIITGIFGTSLFAAASARRRTGL